MFASAFIRPLSFFHSITFLTNSDQFQKYAKTKQVILLDKVECANFQSHVVLKVSLKNSTPDHKFVMEKYSPVYHG